MIDKPTVIITSLGRTGTLFFQKLFEASIPECTCLHEPDRLNFGQYKGLSNKTVQVFRQMGESGAFNLIFRKFLLSDWSIEAVSKGRITGASSDGEAKDRIVSQRKKFIQKQPGTLYIESSSAYYGVIDILTDVFSHHRLIYIIRDGREWVRSKMNFGTMYNKNKLQQRVSGNWPTAVEINDPIYGEKWDKISRFEKICWAWTALNQYALKCVEKNPYARVFRFEDIISAPEAAKNLSDLMNFATSLPLTIDMASSGLEDWVKQKIHSSQKAFPGWDQWSKEQINCFVRICGPLMQKVGYDLKDWSAIP